MIKLKQILEDVVVKNKETGNVYPVKKFNPKTHERVLDDLKKQTSFSPQTTNGILDTVQNNKISEVKEFDLNNPSSIKIGSIVQKNITNTVIKSNIEHIKDNVSKDLSKIVGISHTDATLFLLQWARSSNDNEIKSLTMQQDAAELFNIPLSEFSKNRLEKLKSKIPVEASRVIDKDKQKNTILAIWKNTQNYFKSLGYKPTDKIRLYRGVSFDKEVKYGFHPVSGNALESWTTHKSIAKRFTSEKKYGYVIESDIEIQDLVSTGITGIGCTNELEVIIKGSTPRTAFWQSGW